MDKTPVKKKKKSRLTRTLFIGPDFWQRLTPSWISSANLSEPLGYMIKAISQGQPMTRISIPAMPMSTNSRFLKGKFGMIPHPDGAIYEKMVDMACSNARETVKAAIGQPFGAVIILESDLWEHSGGRMRKADVDNRIKSVFDAIVKAAGIDADHNCQDVHAFKLRSFEQRTTIFLFPRDPYQKIESKS